MASWLPWVRRRRAELRARPLPPEWRATVDHALAHQDLTAAARQTLDGLVQLFLDDKTIEGCGGLQINDTIRLTIAAHACLLLVGLDVDLPYPDLEVVRVYPHTYRADSTSPLGDVRVPQLSHRLGESGRGYVVLSWRAVQHGVARPDDGHNVVLHEFAHQLDTEDGLSDGAPSLPGPMYAPWARILGDAYQELQEDVAAQRRTVLDDYGATNPAEFFAVATETFFEKPQRLMHDDPDLYAIMARYYRQDPAQRPPST